MHRSGVLGLGLRQAVVPGSLGELAEVLHGGEFCQPLVQSERLPPPDRVRLVLGVDPGPGVLGLVQDGGQCLRLTLRIVAEFSAGEMVEDQVLVQAHRAVGRHPAPLVVGAGVQLAVPAVLAAGVQLLGDPVEPGEFLVGRRGRLDPDHALVADHGQAPAVSSSAHGGPSVSSSSSFSSPRVSPRMAPLSWPARSAIAQICCRAAVSAASRSSFVPLSKSAVEHPQRLRHLRRLPGVDRRRSGQLLDQSLRYPAIGLVGQRGGHLTQLRLHAGDVRGAPRRTAPRVPRRTPA